MSTPDVLPRVLLLTVNPLSETSNNGKTYASFFEGYPSDKLAQLYFHRELPSSSTCVNYYRISDEEAVRFAFGCVDHLGGRVDSQTTSVQFVSPSATRALASSRLVRLARAAILKRVILRGMSSLDPWLEDFRPEVIFFCGGDASYLYPLVTAIAAKMNVPIVLYITDDYVLPSLSGGPLAWLSRRIIRGHFRRLCAISAQVLTIGDKMTNLYAARYGVESRPIMNLVSSSPSSAPRQPTDSRTHKILCYAGGLHLNRWRILAAIGASLDRLALRGVQAELQIYTATNLNASMRRSLMKSRSVRVHQSVGQSQLPTVYAQADLLVHVESFALRDRASTRLSVSTKIPEYLASGRSILAVGPPDVASIEYLKASDAAFVSTTLEAGELDSVIENALTDDTLRARRSETGLALAARNHDAARTRHQLWQALVDVSRCSRQSAALSVNTVEPE